MLKPSIMCTIRKVSLKKGFYFINRRCKAFLPPTVLTLICSMIPTLRIDCNTDNKSRTICLIFIKKRHERLRVLGFFPQLKEQNRKRFSEVTEAQKLK